MSEIQFAWDAAKAAENIKNHGVSFEEAQTVFYDNFATEFYDDKHSEWEDRFLLLGLSSHLRLAMVCHCYRESESVIRIISARKATAKECKYYRR
ncbi:MAG: BrnT family toxin [Deltaproteobacteria bacterium]|nr:BrnT family toxin [Deltaproteobacteria bacterium]